MLSRKNYIFFFVFTNLRFVIFCLINFMNYTLLKKKLFIEQLYLIKFTSNPVLIIYNQYFCANGSNIFKSSLFYFLKKNLSINFIYLFLNTFLSLVNK